MPELDLTNALAISIANQDALEIRVADQTIWTKPEEQQAPSHFWDHYPGEEQALNDNHDQGQSITLGAVLQATVSGTVTHIRFPVPAEYIGTTIIAGLYTLEDKPGPLAVESQSIDQVIPLQYQASATLEPSDAGQWRYIELPTPRHINAGQYMLAAVKFNGEGTSKVYFYGTDLYYFNTAITNGDGNLIGPKTGSVPVNELDGNTSNGRFSSPYGIGWPRAIYGARGYYIDVSFYPDI